MQDMDPQSTRAQFTQVTTPGESNMANVSNHLPSPSMALELDTPRAVEVVTGDGIPTGAWAAGLFDCFDNVMPNCFMVTLCPCVALAQLSTRLGVASYRLVLSLLLLVTVLEITSFTLVWTMSDDDDDSSDEGHYYYYGWEHSGHSGNAVANGTFAVLTLLVQMLLFVYIWQLRVKTRTRFQLPGNAATDCLSSWFCSCCTVAQLRTHVRCYQPGDCSFGGPDVLQAYPGKSYAV